MHPPQSGAKPTVKWHGKDHNTLPLGGSCPIFPMRPYAPRFQSHFQPFTFCLGSLSCTNMRPMQMFFIVGEILLVPMAYVLQGWRAL